MSEVTGLVDLIAKYGFSIAVAIYLLWERTKTFSESRLEMTQLNDKYDELVKLLMEVVKANTVAQTELRTTIQKLCEIVNGRPING